MGFGATAALTGFISGVTTDDTQMHQDSLLTAMRSKLADRIGKERYELWFAAGVELRVLKEEGKVQLEVVAPDSFRLERIRRSLLTDLKAVAKEVLGEVPEMDFRVEVPRVEAIAVTKSSSALKLRVDEPVQAPAILQLPAASAPPQFRPRQLAKLEEFVVGDENRLAHAAALEACARPGQVSPVLIYGATGTGKTHLLEGISSRLRASGRLRSVLLLSAEQFTTQFIEALRTTGLPSFRRKVRDVDAFILDDLQFLQGKQSTLIELQNTVDGMLREGKQLIFAADRPPAELRSLGMDLVARISGGLVCGVQPSGYVTRQELLRRAAADRNLDLDAECIAWLAQQLPGDARQLSGALHRLAATSQMLGLPPNLEMAKRHLMDLFHATRRAIRLPDIIHAVCEVFGMEESTLQSSGKSASVSHPRMLAMFLARKHTRTALSEIGRHFGRKSHSTVLSAEDKVSDWIAQGKSIAGARGQVTVEEALRQIENQLMQA